MNQRFIKYVIRIMLRLQFKLVIPRCLLRDLTPNQLGPLACLLLNDVPPIP